MPQFRWYYILFSLPLFLLALLPMPLLYLFSEVVQLLLYYVLGYRKKVVLLNLRNSFPDRDEKWIRQISRAYYRNLVDVMLETIKMAFVPARFYLRRVKIIESDTVKKLRENMKPIVLVCGHQANWEWAGNAFQLTVAPMDVLYHPLSSKWFNWYMYFLRTRHGMYPVPMQAVLREMLNRRHIPAATTFIADQAASPEGCYWMTFLNQDTPVFVGTEKLARRFNYPVVYGEILRERRGYYTVSLHIISENPAAEPEFYITEKHTQMLEASILKQPESWLWSHKRWKHKRKQL